MDIKQNILETIGNTPLIRLNKITRDFPCTVLAKVDYFNPGNSIKDRMAVKMVDVAEKEGKPISLLVVPATDVFEAIMVTAQRLDSSRVVCGLSNKLSADEQAKLTGDAWERLAEPRPRLMLEVCAPDGSIREYALGPHTPRLRAQDLELMHQLWLNITSDPRFSGAHHYHIVALALEELQRELTTEQRAQLLQKLQEEMNRPNQQ